MGRKVLLDGADKKRDGGGGEGEGEGEGESLGVSSVSCHTGAF